MPAKRDAMLLKEKRICIAGTSTVDAPHLLFIGQSMPPGARAKEQNLHAADIWQ